MKRTAKTAILAALCLTLCQPLYSCRDKKNADSDSSAAVSDTADASQPATSEDEAELGVYTVSDKGIKLYYEDSGFAEDYDAKGIITALETYFLTYAEKDYDAYLECVYPEYVAQMTAYLEENYGYGMEGSFDLQCDNLKNQMGGDYKITRIKIEAPEKDGSEEYLTDLSENYLEKDFYETVKADCDALHDLTFYVMAEANGEETLLISQFEIVFAEKDGKYYAFG